ncbi:MAG: ATP-binding protein [bacterium]|nr:ATP-binding protein [bacterium]
MLNEETYNKLVEMKMAGFSAAFQEYANEPTKDELSFDERFGLMVDREWSERQERRLRYRLRCAKLRHEACVEDIDYRHPRGLDKSVIQRLSACQWISNSENLIITGPTGVGKSWIACALANKACREGYTTKYARVPRLLQDLYVSHADGSYAKEMKKLLKPSVLILDDLGLSPLNESQRRDLLEVVEDRYARKSIIVTSQLPTKKWHDTIGDPTIADAILDRLVHNAHRIEMRGKSMRKKSENPKTNKNQKG